MDARELDPSDLAPGDRKALAFDWSGVELELIRSCEGPAFKICYGQLWDEFGPHGGMEQQSVIRQRMAWDPAKPIDGRHMLYEMFLVRQGERFAAAVDLTAIVAREEPSTGAVVHLSHLLVHADFRRSGLAGWLRALPVGAARRCIAAAGLPPTTPITIVAEVEPPLESEPQRMLRLLTYERSGFLKIDPARLDYVQPDFRAPEQIDAAGHLQLLPLSLLVRRVGREHEMDMGGSELRTIVAHIYGMYGASFRQRDMGPVWERLCNLPAADTNVRLLPATT